MTLHPHSIGPVPEETARIAHAACPKGNPYLQMRDLLGTVYDDQLFAALFPPQGQATLARWRLALVCIMQFSRAAYRIGKPQKPCACALTGNTHSIENCVGETMRHALEALAVVAPVWLLGQVCPEWKERVRTTHPGISVACE